MANSSLLLFVGLAVLANCMIVESATCASGAPGYCYCTLLSSGISLECNAYYYTPENIKSNLEFYKPYGPIVSLRVFEIRQSTFNYVPDDFLSGNQIPSVSFECYHSNSVGGGLLMFSNNAFTDASGACGLTGNVTFRDCNLRQFDTATLNNCNQLTNLAFMDSHVDKIINIPTLESLKNFTVYSPRLWTGATQRGLSQMSLAPGASLPQLNYLDVSGNSLGDDSIEFVSQLKVIEEMHLEGNNFTVVPNLTDSFYLHTFSMTMNSSKTDISISFPNPRMQMRNLKATFDSNSPKTVYDVTSLTGKFGQDIINFKLNMTEFKENTFFSPLSESYLTINLNPDAKIQCGCRISWLVRDNPSLLAQVNNGTCTDGRPFESIPVEEVVCCSTESLVRRINVLQKKVKDLEAAKRLQ